MSEESEELKKRIQERGELKYEILDDCLKLSHYELRELELWGKELVRIITRIEAILDEAKQDILGWWKQHPRYLAEKQKEGDYVDLDAFYRARDDWLYKLEKKLKKWFGEEIEEVVWWCQ